MSEFFEQPTPRPSASANDSGQASRRRLLVRVATGLLALLVLMVGILAATDSGPFGDTDAGQDATKGAPYGVFSTSGVLGDTDGDGAVDEDEESALVRTERSVATLRSAAFARRDVNTTLVTPAGQGWWDLVTSAADTLKISDAPLPNAASWYAMTETATHGVNNDNHPYPGYQTLFLKFATYDDATEWARLAIQILEQQPFAVYVRPDGLLIMTPASVEPRNEPLPRQVTGKGSAALDALDVPMGYWTINWTDWLNIRADRAIDPGNFREIWKGLGITGGTWTATSPRPDAAWAGRLDGYRADDVDLVKSLQAINTLGFDTCRSTAECRTAGGSRDAIYQAWFEQGGKPVGGIDGWRHPLAPRDVDWYAGMSPSFDPLLFGTRAYFTPPVIFTAYWHKGDLLYMLPVLGEAAQGITVSQ